MRTLAWMDRAWRDGSALLDYPSAVGSPTNPYQRPGVPVVRETASYAVGLLERDGPGDRARAARALAAICAHQVDAPGHVAHGTWRRSPAEPWPGPTPREWIDYDPNWREFVGTAFALALDHEAKLDEDTIALVERALRRAAVGSLAREVAPDYTNIALMSAFLLDACGARFGEGAWQRRGAALGEAVAAAYRRGGAFPEHNSPTYYGVDLFGLALWRARAPSPRLRALGEELEATLWRDLSRFYHAGLRNLCGPWTRAYGMDMTRYVGSLGAWIALATPGAPAPLPRLGDAAPHGHDFCWIPLIAALGSHPPDDVREALVSFPGEHGVTQTITEHPRRVASAWLGERVMAGGEHSSGRPVHWQHHPATLHWALPEGGVGWLRLVTTAPVDAVAERGRLRARVHTGLAWLRAAEIPVWLEHSPAPAVPLPFRDGARWALPGLRLRLSLRPDVPGRSEAGALPGSTRCGTVFAPGAAPRALELVLELEPAGTDAPARGGPA